ncbi:MAG: MGMT family protein [Clostridia bacterium]|nr:MGMT family protein [Clostridia bacterium]
MTFFERVYEALKKVPKGTVVTYGQLAYAIGAPRCARQVGYALHVNPEPYVIPCYRVVNRFGRLAPAFAFGGEEIQAELLRAEGVEVRSDFTVDLDVYLYRGNL